MEKSTDRFTVLCSTFFCIVLFGAMGSCGIVAIALGKFTNVSDAGMFAIALMSGAPAALGIGVSLFLYLAYAVEMRSPRSAPHESGSEQFVRRLD